MKNKIIFLDIDGVLNSDYYWKEIRNKTSSLSSIEQDVDRRCVANLKQIIKLTNAKVVVSASMRGKRKFEDFKECVGREGISIYGVTSHSTGGGINRGAEIRQWLDEHKEEVDKFIIFDDDIFPDFNELVNNLIKLDYYKGKGIEAKHVEQAVQMLGKSREDIEDER